MSSRPTFCVTPATFNTSGKHRFMRSVNERVDALSGNIATSSGAYVQAIEDLAGLTSGNDKFFQNQLDAIGGQVKENTGNLESVEEELPMITENVSNAILALQKISEEAQPISEKLVTKINKLEATLANLDSRITVLEKKMEKDEQDAIYFLGYVPGEFVDDG